MSIVTPDRPSTRRTTTDRSEDTIATPPTDVQPPALIREGSNVFAAIAVAALLVGGLAGVARDGDDPRAASLSSEVAGAADHHGDDVASGSEGHHDDGHPGATGDVVAAHPHDAGAGEPSGVRGTGVEHDHMAGTQTAPTGDGHTAHGTSTGLDDDGPGHEAHDGASGHAEHDPSAEGDVHHHAGGCTDDHPTSVALVAEVQGELATTYKDVAALIALGYHPYFDSLVPGGYPPGGEGISHWINPNYIDDGVVLDPHRPETILLDDWYWPIGMMFINDPGVPPVPVYVNDDGTACSPWHPHTDAPARFGWYYYRAVYDRSLEDEVPAQTPEMMHVWAVPNPAGVYAAHDYPPREVRSGPPGPLPSYFSDVTIPGS